MALQDSNPERRNLSLLSFIFIAFFLGGGSFPDSDLSLRLLVITVSFSRPEALVLLIWLIFFWFLYRYWVVHREVFSKKFQAETNELRTLAFIEKFVSKSIGRPIAPKIADTIKGETGIIIEKMFWRESHLQIHIMDKELNRDEYGIIRGQGRVEGGLNKTIRLTGIIGLLITIRLIVHCIIMRPSFSSYIVPYIYSAIAVLLASLRYVF